MALAFAGAAALTGQSASGSSFTVNLPASIAIGDLIQVKYQTNDISRYLVASGWINLTTGARTTGIIYKIADGTEGATETFNTNTGTTILNGAVARRITGFDSLTTYGAPVNGTEASEDPFTLAANLLTGLTAGSWVILVWGGSPTASRSIVTLDADLTLIGSTGDSRVHAAAETAPGSGNAAYSTDMSGARDWDYTIVELFAAASGPASQTISPDAVVATFVLGNPTVTPGGVIVSPDVAAAVFGVGEPTVSEANIPQVANPDPAIGTFEVSEPELVEDSTLSPDPAVATFQLPSPVASGGSVQVIFPLISNNHVDLNDVPKK